MMSPGCSDTATVRARTAVDTLVPREDFAALLGQFEVLGAYFDRLMSERYGRARGERPLRPLPSGSLD